MLNTMTLSMARKSTWTLRVVSDINNQSTRNSDAKAIRITVQSEYTKNIVYTLYCRRRGSSDGMDMMVDGRLDGGRTNSQPGASSRCLNSPMVMNIWVIILKQANGGIIMSNQVQGCIIRGCRQMGQLRRPRLPRLPTCSVYCDQHCSWNRFSAHWQLINSCDLGCTLSSEARQITHCWFVIVR
jgi:hypothetical protein